MITPGARDRGHGPTMATITPSADMPSYHEGIPIEAWVRNPRKRVDSEGDAPAWWVSCGPAGLVVAEHRCVTAYVTAGLQEVREALAPFPVDVQPVADHPGAFTLASRIFVSDSLASLDLWRVVSLGRLIASKSGPRT